MKFDQFSKFNSFYHHLEKILDKRTLFFCRRYNPDPTKRERNVPQCGGTIINKVETDKNFYQLLFCRKLNFKLKMHIVCARAVEKHSIYFRC